MAKRTITFETVKTLGLALPGVEPGTSYRSPALKVNGLVMACMASNKQADPDSLCLSLDFAQRDELVEADPETFYLRDHYVPWPCVLVRLSRVHMDALRDLLAMSHTYVVSKKRKKLKSGSGAILQKRRK